MNFVTKTDGSGYLSIEPIYNLMLYKSRYFISDNLKVMDVEQYIVDYLAEYRKLKRDYKQKKNIEGYKITYLLPIDINISEDITKLRVLTNSIIQFVAPSTKIKYLSYVKRGSGNTKYLTIILLDRHYYPNGRLIKRLRPNTRIVDNKGSYK